MAETKFPLCGGWFINIIVKNLPEEIDKVFELLNKGVGASYKPLAQLATKVVAGTWFAALGEQTILDKDNTKNHVVVYFFVNLEQKIEGISVEQVHGNIVMLPDGQIINISDIVSAKCANIDKDNVHVVIDAMPEKIASAFTALELAQKGAKYRPVAYLGTRGNNHGVLAEQIMVDENATKNIVLSIAEQIMVDENSTKNIVLIIFKEIFVPGEISKIALVSFNSVLCGTPSKEVGGVLLNEDFKITEEAQEDFDKVVKKITGVGIKPFAYLGYQVVNGDNRFFAAEATPLCANDDKFIAIVTTNALCDRIHSVKIF